jgi:hypothetical protein
MLAAHIGRALSSLYGFRNSSAGACAPTLRTAMTAAATMTPQATLALRFIETLLRPQISERQPVHRLWSNEHAPAASLMVLNFGPPMMNSQRCGTLTAGERRVSDEQAMASAAR